MKLTLAQRTDWDLEPTEQLQYCSVQVRAALVVRCFQGEPKEREKLARNENARALLHLPAFFLRRCCCSDNTMYTKTYIHWPVMEALLSLTLIGIDVLSFALVYIDICGRGAGMREGGGVSSHRESSIYSLSHLVCAYTYIYTHRYTRRGIPTQITVHLHST